MDRKLTRVGVACLAVVSLLPTPIPAQDRTVNAPAAPAPNSTEPDVQTPPSAAAPPRTVDLKLDYSVGRKWFPRHRWTVFTDEKASTHPSQILRASGSCCRAEN